MKAQHVFGLDLSWRRVTVVFLIDVAIMVLVSQWPGESPYVRHVWWSGVAVAALLTVVALTTYRRVSLSSALAARILDRFADSAAMLDRGRRPAIDHRRRYGHEPVGIREYGGRLVAMIAVSAEPAVSGGRHHRGTEPQATLPLRLVASGLRQFDVVLDGIDIISVGAGSDTADDTAAAGDGAHTADGRRRSAGHRRTWLVLRMDPQHNVGAIAARDSVASTLAAAAERMAHELAGRQIAARVLTAEEFAGVDTAVLAGLQPTEVRSRRRRLKQKHPKAVVASFWVSPHDITTKNLAQLWRSAFDTAVVTIRLRPRHGRTQVSVLARYHHGDRLSKQAWVGLNRLTGRQLSAVCASLPTPVWQSVPALPERELDDQDPLAVSLGAEQQRPAAPVGAQP